MGGTEMVVLIVFICVLGGILQTWLKQQKDNGINGEALDRLQQRLDRIEQRMANIETIVIEREKKQEFERVL